MRRFSTNFQFTKTLDNLKKNKLKMYASEKLMFVKSLGILVGDLIPEDNDDCRLFILKLREIISLILSPAVHKDTRHQLLQKIIEEHNELYIRLSCSNLKPKFHFLIIYP